MVRIPSPLEILTVIVKRFFSFFAYLLSKSEPTALYRIVGQRFNTAANETELQIKLTNKRLPPKWLKASAIRTNKNMLNGFSRNDIATIC